MTSVLTKIDLLSPFLRSTQEIFETMLSCRCRFGDRVPNLDVVPADSVAATIFLEGRLDGILTVCFPSQTCIRILEQMTGIEVDSVDEMVCDALGEFTNVVGGKGKRDLSQFELILGLPQVTVGESALPGPTGWRVHHRVPMQSEIGEGWLYVGFDVTSSRIPA